MNKNLKTLGKDYNLSNLKIEKVSQF